MVHHGPAKGCQRCKDRHVKCGLERPACRQCTRLQFNCPGYRHELDIVLRNQTPSVVRRSGSSEKRHRLGANPRYSPQTANTMNSKSYSLPIEVVPPFDSLVLPFLFGSHEPMQDQRASHGHLDFLPTLYQQAPSESPLSKTISWLAFVLVGILFDRDLNWWNQHRGEEARLMAGVLRNIQRAIADPVRSVQIDTVAAVVLLVYGEYLRTRTYGHSSRYSPLSLSSLSQPPQNEMKNTFIIHQAGAETLIRNRGALNFQDSVSLALFAAVRHNAVGIAMSGMEMTETRTANWDLWDTTGNRSGHLCDSYTPATELDACGARMVVLHRRLSSRSEDDDSVDMLLRKDLVDLLERLRIWPRCAPGDWKIILAQEGKSAMKYKAAPEGLFLSPEVTYLINQWNLLQLGVSHLLKQVCIGKVNNAAIERHDYTENDFLFENERIDDIIASAHLYLEHRPPTIQADPILTFSEQTVLPIGNIRQLCVARHGSRLLSQTIEKLDIVLSNALQSLELPKRVNSRYREVVEWIKRERRGGSLF